MKPSDESSGRAAPGMKVAMAIVFFLSLPGVIYFSYARERKTMDMKNEPAVLHTGRPPIDAASPAGSETATFAMG